MTSVSIVELGIGNIRSVANALKRVGCEAAIPADGDELRAQAPDKIVLPGVGAVGAAYAGLEARGFIPVLQELVIDRKTPVLGICVGMQVLAETCEEFGAHETLGWIPGRVVKIETGDPKLTVPHVGWNDIRATTDDPLLANVSGDHFYFCHSFAMECPKEFVIGRFEYGRSFVCAVRRDNVCGIQFHPEKSSGHGERVLRAFVQG
ncbi:MAG: imidazole glycerol phosphate synthase subunit HisH [Rhodospirillales bacterium]